jgi:predicted  nucleic acid-binding Zn-ribbon protein
MTNKHKKLLKTLEEYQAALNALESKIYTVESELRIFSTQPNKHQKNMGPLIVPAPPPNKTSRPS